MSTDKITARIIELKPKKLIGMKLQMSLSNNRTGELWRSFMPFRSHINHTMNRDLISMQVYTSNHFSNFSLENSFEKWACIEVASVAETPTGLESFELEGGLYAVFDYKGSSTDNSIFQMIFGKWLPESEYDLDDRPHFEILGDKYKNNDPESEEEIWIPIKPKISST